MNRTILHIGMPRAASTFFQQEVFPQVEGFDFKGVDFSFYHPVLQRVQFQDDSYYDEKSIQSQLKQTTEKNLILSNELFVGQSLYLKSTNRTRTAQRLKILFPNAEIVLFLRNQLSLLQSLYAIGVYDGLSKKPEDFFPLESSIYPTFERVEIAESYKYTELIKLYTSLFESVEVFLFEDFKANPEQFVIDFANKMNIEVRGKELSGKRVNSSLGSTQIKSLRRLNKWKPILSGTKLGSKVFTAQVKFIEHYLGSSRPFQFNDSLSKKIKNYYRTNNTELGEYLPYLKSSENFKKYY